MSLTDESQPDRTLAGQRILVVEDDYHLAREMSCALAALGARIVGPAATLAQALDLIASQAPFDGAVLDLNLRGQLADAAADALVACGTPLVIVSGFDSGVVADRHARLPRLEKPAAVAEVARLLQAQQAGA